MPIDARRRQGNFANLTYQIREKPGGGSLTFKGRSLISSGHK